MRPARAHVALLHGAGAASADDFGFPQLVGARRAFATDRIQVLGVPNGGPTGRTCVFGVLASMPKGASGACAENATFNAQGVVATLHSDGGDVDVIGLVPDGVSSVEVDLGDGSKQVVDVVDNGYTIHAQDTPASVSFDSPAGAVQRINVAG